MTALLHVGMMYQDFTIEHFHGWMLYNLVMLVTYRVSVNIDTGQ